MQKTNVKKLLIILIILTVLAILLIMIRDSFNIDYSFFGIQSKVSSLSSQLQTNKQSVKADEEFSIYISLNEDDIINDPILVYKGQLNYDENLFNNVTASDFECMNSWSNLKYNEETKEFIIINENGTTNNEEIVKVNLSVKNIQNLPENTKISVNNIEVSDENAMQLLTNNEIELTFEEETTLTSIGITNPPNKTDYIVGEVFDISGLEITANYSDGSSKTITDYIYSPSTALTINDSSIIFTYTEGDITETTTLQISVTEPTTEETFLTSISITNPPNKTDYIVGEVFDISGLEITANYSDGSSKAITDYIYSPSSALTINDSSITFTYTEGGIAETTTLQISVTQNVIDNTQKDDDIPQLGSNSNNTVLLIIIITFTLIALICYIKQRKLNFKKFLSLILVITIMNVSIINTKSNATILKGDMNNDGLINIQDIVIIEEHIINLNIIEDQELINEADFNSDGSINILDIAKMLKYDESTEEEVLLNPGKGFVQHLYTEGGNEVYPITTVLYTRISWSRIEPEEGVYNWSIIDSGIEKAKNLNKKYAFGIMGASTSSGYMYVSPKWVFDSGAEGRILTTTNWETGESTEQVIPVWTDSIYLEKLNNFIEALGKRYNGNENIAFIDIRSYGNWGEQHTSGIGGEALTANELKELYIQPYIEAFPDTLLVNPCGNDNYKEVYEWAIEQGVTVRRDGIFLYSDGSECEMAYGKLPSIFEYTGTYEWMKENDLWSQSELLKYILNGKPSYIQFDTKMYEENEEFLNMLANKIGYYFNLYQSNYSIANNKNIDISFKVINEGVAPLYEPCTVYIALMKDNEVVKKYKTDIDAQSWMPNVANNLNYTISYEGIENGTYEIALGLFYNENDDKPTYLLKSDFSKTEDNWYILGNIEIN